MHHLPIFLLPRRYLVAFFFIGFWVMECPTPLWAQLDNSAFHLGFEADTAQPKAFSFQLYTLGFFKNNEFDNEILEGYTLFGYQANPRLRYQPDKYLLIEAGLFARKDFGNNAYTLVQPTFTLKYQRGGFSMVFGNLEGALSHNLIEPLYDFENVIDNRLENGIQFKMDRPKWSADLWVDWRKMIYDNSPFQEEISGGLHAAYHWINRENLRLSSVLQATIYHYGGQIDTTNAPIVSTWNVAPGFVLKMGDLSADGKQKGRSLVLEGYYTRYGKDAATERLAFENGYGWYFNATANFPFLSGMVSYWHGNQFLSLVGGGLFNSQSLIAGRQDVTEPQRELLFVRLMKDIAIGSGTTLTVRLQPYIDLRNQIMEYYYGLYLNTNLSFLLKQF